MYIKGIIVNKITGLHHPMPRLKDYFPHRKDNILSLQLLHVVKFSVYI